MADRQVMIQGVDDQSDILAHVTVDIIFLFQELRSLIYQVGGQKTIKQSLIVGVVKLIQTVGKKSESGADVDPAGTAFLEKGGGLMRANIVVDRYCKSPFLL